jgi:FkbH-like protein
VDDRFTDVQQTYRALSQRGVLLCLATKNDLSDVKEALGRDGMALTYTSFVHIEAGWHSKPDMLRMIAGELNIGLDAIVFVDDSTFECESVRAQLPEVCVVQVPADLDEYPRVASEVAALFPAMVDTSKTEEYRALAASKATRAEYATEAEFLRSLGMRVWANCNQRSEVGRIAELTQKANQFNLTTQRYTEDQIRGLMGHGRVYSLHYSDRFGDQGIIGVVILTDGQIDTFILSCRILGRGVERMVWSHILDDATEDEQSVLTASYIPTAKNGQVADLWERLGMELLRQEPNGTRIYVGWPH